MDLNVSEDLLSGIKDTRKKKSRDKVSIPRYQKRGQALWREVKHTGNKGGILIKTL